MKIPIPVLISRLQEDRHPESDGYYDGAHGTPVEHGVEEIAGKFEQRKAELQRDSVLVQKSLESKVQYLEEISPELEKLWAAVRERSGERLPNIVWPSAMLLIGLLAVTSEALMLSPALDVVNITDPAAPSIAAFRIACIA